LNEKLTPSEHERGTALIDSIPDDGTDWDGVSPDTIRVLIVMFEKAKEWDKVVLNPDYIEQTENALKELRHDNIQLKEDLAQSMDQVRRILPITEKQAQDNKWLILDLKSMKQSFALANNWRNAHLDDAKLLGKIKEFHDKSDWTNMWKEIAKIHQVQQP